MSRKFTHTVKLQNRNIFEKFKLNRNLQMIPFKMMYNMSVFCHWFSNKQLGGGGGGRGHLERPSSLDLFCKSVYFD